MFCTPLSSVYIALGAISLLSKTVFASPYPMPLALAVGRSPSSMSGDNNTSHTRLARSPYDEVIALEPRDPLSGLLSQLTLSSTRFRDFSQQDVQGDNEAYQHQAAGLLGDFQALLEETHLALKPLAKDKGLANYDKDIPLETALKDLVNANKMVLKSISVLTDKLPIVGPILGPIVYQVKCILDDVLDFAENLTDGLLNNLNDLLGGCILGYGRYVCGPGALNIAGLCLGDLLNIGSGGLLGGLGLGL